MRLLHLVITRRCWVKNVELQSVYTLVSVSDKKRQIKASQEVGRANKINYLIILSKLLYHISGTMKWKSSPMVRMTLFVRYRAACPSTNVLKSLSFALKQTVNKNFFVTNRDHYLAIKIIIEAVLIINNWLVIALNIKTKAGRCSVFIIQDCCEEIGIICEFVHVKLLLTNRAAGTYLNCHLISSWALSRKSIRVKKRPSYPNFVNSEACSFECPNGSISILCAVLRIHRTCPWGTSSPA